ncbi:glycosyltransferase, partial [Burkholderia cenocepacia]|uniref:glycosyltransferase n=1 Tax=Burkholderia cenocepacia TaxID=95486 RepID=UPI0022317593
MSEIESAYGFRFDPQKTVVVPHGLAAKAVTVEGQSAAKSDSVTLLFVGRLEPRKGIDVLLEALPEVMADIPSLKVRVIGDDTLPGPGGRTFKDAFVDSDAGRK